MFIINGWSKNYNLVWVVHEHLTLQARFTSSWKMGQRDTAYAHNNPTYWKTSKVTLEFTQPHTFIPQANMIFGKRANHSSQNFVTESKVAQCFDDDPLINKTMKNSFTNTIQFAEPLQLHIQVKAAMVQSKNNFHLTSNIIEQLPV